MAKYSRCVSVPGKSSQALYEQLSSDIDRFLAKISIGKVEVTRDEKNKSFDVKSSLLKAVLTCQEEQILVEAELSFLAMPFRSKIDTGIDKWIERTFQKS